MKRQYVQLFLIGVALSIAQFIMIRDFVSILYGEEVVIVLVTASFFLGLSVGYTLALRISLQTFQYLFVGSVFLHLTFPFSYRYLGAQFAVWDLEGPGFLALLFGYALIFNTMFATVLPRLITLPEEPGESEVSRLKKFYGLELAGFITGFGIVAASWNHTIGFLLTPYWLILGVILYLTLRRKVLTGVYAAGAALAVVFVAPLDSHSTAKLYEDKHRIRDAKTLYSVNSPYQKVEVIEGRRGKRYLYLDGLRNLDSGSLTHLNYYIAEVPARLIRPRKALLIGNGTLSSVPKVYPHTEKLISVELDGGVLRAGSLHFTSPEELADYDRWELRVDDGKHFMRTTEDRFDLIVMDVPSPLTIQEAYLHTVEFYALAKASLTEQGVIAVQLSGPLQRNNRSPARITAALRQVFPEVLVIYSDRADRGFAYASMDLPFTAEDVRGQGDLYRDELKLVRPDKVDSYLKRAVPLAADTMDLVLRRGWERFTNRYFDD